MSKPSVKLELTAKDLASAFGEGPWAEKYPPVLTLEQAAALLQVPKQTIYDWRSRGELTGCSRKVGKHVRFWRDKLIQKLFNEGLKAYERKPKQKK
jgi:excisionase family DNA binding protein